MLRYKYRFKDSPYLPKGTGDENPMQCLKRVLKDEYMELKHATSQADKEPELCLQPASPHFPYRFKPSEIRPLAACPSLKWFCAELQFIKEHEEFDIVIFGGVGYGGKHLQKLAAFFPNKQFVVYDKLQQQDEWKSCENLTVFRKWINLEDCDQWNKKKVLFIASGQLHDRNKDENANVVQHLAKQEELICNLKPISALLRFRLPFISGTTNYFTGELRFPVFSDQNGTELHLVVTDFSQKINYDHDVYADQCYYFNNFTRVVRRPDYLRFGFAVTASLWHSIGIDFCWDCCVFLINVLRYQTPPSVSSEMEIFVHIRSLLEMFEGTKHLMNSPHGVAFEQWIDERHKFHGMPRICDSKHRVHLSCITFVQRAHNEVGFPFSSPLATFH